MWTTASGASDPAPRTAQAVAAAVATEARPPHPLRPWVVANMVTSLDGATSADGVSGPLGAPADKVVFRALRAVADVVLVGAGTVRAESYGPPILAERVQRERVAAGRTPRPRLAVITSRLELDWSARLFDDDPPPIVLTTDDAPAQRAAEAERRAEVRRHGRCRVDLVSALSALSADADVVLCEGGPSVLGQLVERHLLDELCLTVSPTLVGKSDHGLVAGLSHGVRRLSLVRVAEADGMLFLRYLTAPRGAPGREPAGPSGG